MMHPGQLIHWEWHRTREGREAFLSILHRNMHRRKTFGLLERPIFPNLSEAPEEMEYKIFVYGKSGVGKTSTVAKLTGTEVPTTHCDTEGIQVGICYWPVKLQHSEKVVLFRLHFWDVGDAVLKRYKDSYMLPACKSGMDAVLYVFSVTDKSSFGELQHLSSRLLADGEQPAEIVVAAKCDLMSKCEVSLSEMHEYEQLHERPVLRVQNIPDYDKSEMRSDLAEVAPILDSICERLLFRDHVLGGASAQQT